MTIVDDAVGVPVVFDVDAPRQLSRVGTVLTRISVAAAMASVVIGTVVLVGYATGAALAIRLRYSLPPMYPNAALGLALGGLSTLAAISRVRAVQMAARVGFALIGVVATFTLLLHMLDAGPTWLEGLWPDDPVVPATTPVAGRPVAETCVAFMAAAGGGWLMAARRRAHISQAFALGTVTVGAVAIIGYMIGVDRQALGLSLVAVGMALHTGIGLFVLGLAVLLAAPTTGLLAALTHSGASAQLRRRLLFVVVIAPIGLTTASALLDEAVPDADLARSVASVVQVLALGLLVMLPMAAAESIERTATDSLREARRLAEEAGERDRVLAEIGDELMSDPDAPPGWTVALGQEIAFASLPGDSCQLINLSGARSFLVAVIDVAGHGTEPALHAIRLRAKISALWRADIAIEQIVMILNDAVRRMDTIASAVIAEVDRTSGRCRFVNAGHPAPVVLEPDGSIRRWHPTTPILGVPMEGQVTASDDRLLEASIVVVYTDGVIEARDRERVELGEDPLLQVVRQRRAGGVDAIARGCIDLALGHTPGRINDDALVLVLQAGQLDATDESSVGARP